MLQQEQQDYLYYTPEQLSALDFENIPQHIAFIPDGNRRWAKKRDTSASKGHQEGADILMDIAKAAKALGVKVCTFYVFSTENWRRDQLEVQALLWLLESYLIEQRPVMVESGIQFQTIGDLSRFPASICKTIQSTKDATAHCTGMDMVLALNYGARDEICRAFNSILNNGAWQKEAITEKMISQHLDTAQWPDPELLIRTSGEQRLSNFLLWQTSYTEMYTINVLWPDFTPQHLLSAVLNFQQRERRLGGSSC